MNKHLLLTLTLTLTVTLTINLNLTLIITVHDVVNFPIQPQPIVIFAGSYCRLHTILHDLPYKLGIERVYKLYSLTFRVQVMLP